MAAATAVTLDIIAGMQRVVRGPDDQNGFKIDTPQISNRGNKLKRKDRSTENGSLTGQRPYKKRIKHSGYHRYILHRKPKRYDEDGYELDDDDEDEEADREAASKDPYNEIAIEKLLMPLTAASDLENHPTLSAPYKSQVLYNMTQQAGEMLQKERRVLANLKLLMTDLRGDNRWIPGGHFYTDDDVKLYAADSVPSAGYHSPSEPESIALRAEKEQEAVAAAAGTSAELSPHGGVGGGDQAPKPAQMNGAPRSADERGDQAESMDVDGKEDDTAPQRDMQEKQSTGPEEDAGKESAKPDSGVPENAGENGNGKADTKPNGGQATEAPAESPPKDAEAGDEPAPPPRMVTRGQAQAQARTSTSSPPADGPHASTATPTAIHPLYRWPARARPDRACGLPEAEAEETRRVLGAVVQKQEEVVHCTAQMYEGLLRADRLARTVWSWCRAEAHAGEMSDGEDWVDPEEWGLDAPLKKGQEEAEDPGEKKPRGRRTAQ